MKVKRIVFCALVVGSRVLAQTQDYPVGVRAQAMGGSGVACAVDPEGQLLNPALVAELSAWAATAFYSHPFGVQEITLSSLCLRGRIGAIAGGAALLRLAHESFQDQVGEFTLAHSFSVTRRAPAGQSSGLRFSWGVQVAVREIAITHYGATRTLIASMGGVAQLNSRLTWGAKLGNLFDAKIGTAHEPLPREMCLGIACLLKPGAVFQLDAYKESDFPLEWRGGVEYRVLAPLSLRLGLSSNPNRLTCGFALWLRPLLLQIAVFSHTDLGWTQQYAVTLQK